MYSCFAKSPSTGPAGRSGPLEPAAPLSLVTVVPAPRLRGDSFGNEGFGCWPWPEAGRHAPSCTGWGRLPNLRGQALAGGGASCALFTGGSGLRFGWVTAAPAGLAWSIRSCLLVTWGDRRACGVSPGAFAPACWLLVSPPRLRGDDRGLAVPPLAGASCLHGRCPPESKGWPKGCLPDSDDNGESVTQGLRVVNNFGQFLGIFLDYVQTWGWMRGNCLNCDSSDYRMAMIGSRKIMSIPAPYPVIPAKAGIQRAYYEIIGKAGNGFGPGFLPSQE